MAVTEDAKGTKSINVWGAPREDSTNKVLLQEGLSLREAFFYLKGFKDLRSVYRKGLAKRVAAIFGSDLQLG